MLAKHGHFAEMPKMNVKKDGYFGDKLDEMEGDDQEVKGNTYGVVFAIACMYKLFKVKTLEYKLEFEIFQLKFFWL